MGNGRTDEALTEADHIRVVVLPGEACRHCVVNCSRADSGDLARRHTDPDAGSAHSDAQIGLSRCDRPPNSGPIVRIIDTSLGISPHIENLYPSLPKLVPHGILHVKASVVGSNCDLHRVLHSDAFFDALSADAISTTREPS